MSQELLPCPFCGGRPAIVLGIKQTVRTVDVICQACGGAMPAFCEDDAIGDWNARFTNPSLNAVTGSSGTHPVTEGAADNAPPAIREALGNLPLQYVDGPDYCTVTDATGAAFALTVQPELMKIMEAAALRSPVDARCGVQNEDAAANHAFMAQEVLDFLNSIEGDGYGGMAAFEIVRGYARSLALPSADGASK